MMTADMILIIIFVILVGIVYGGFLSNYPPGCDTAKASQVSLIV